MARRMQLPRNTVVNMNTVIYLAKSARLTELDGVPETIRSICCRAPVIRVAGSLPWKCGECGHRYLSHANYLLLTFVSDKYTNFFRLMEP